MAYQFESARLDDFNQLVPLVDGFYQFLAVEKNQPPDSKREQTRQRRYLKRYLLEANCNYLVCRNNYQLVGYTFLSIELKKKRVGYINELFVIEAVRGNHVGRLLVEESIKWLKERGCETINLTVSQTNQIAFTLYTQMGFQRQHADYVDMTIQV